MIEEQPEFLQKEDILKKLAHLKYKEILREVLAEYKRRGNFIMIYPNSNSEQYDKFFASPRPLNRYIYKLLFTDYLGLSEMQKTLVQVTKEVLKLPTQVKVPVGLMKIKSDLEYSVGSTENSKSPSRGVGLSPLNFYNKGSDSKLDQNR